MAVALGVGHRPGVGRRVRAARSSRLGHCPCLGLSGPRPRAARWPPSEGTSPELMGQRPAGGTLSRRPPGASPSGAHSAAPPQAPATTPGTARRHLLGRASFLWRLSRAVREATRAGGSTSRPPGPQDPFSGVGRGAGGRSSLEGLGAPGRQRGAEAWARPGLEGLATGECPRGPGSGSGLAFQSVEKYCENNLQGGEARPGGRGDGPPSACPPD